MGTHQDITNINITGEDALRGGAGGAAVTNAANSDLGQVARRRTGALAAIMAVVVCREAAMVMTDTKIAVPSSGMGPGEGLALGGGAAGIWKIMVHGVDTLPGGVDCDLAEIGLSSNGARPGVEFRGGGADGVNSATLVMQFDAVYVVCNCLRGMAFAVLLEPNGSHFGLAAFKDVSLIASTADIAWGEAVVTELAATDFSEVKYIDTLDARPELRVVGAGAWMTTPDALACVVGVRRAGGRRQEGAEAAVHKACRLVSAYQAKAEAPPPEPPPGRCDQRRHALPYVGQAARRGGRAGELRRGAARRVGRAARRAGGRAARRGGPTSARTAAGQRAARTGRRRRARRRASGAGRRRCGATCWTAARGRVRACAARRASG